MLVWLFWIGQQLTGSEGRSVSLIVSMFIVPLYFVLNHVGKVLINESVESLGLGQIADDEFPDDAEEAFKVEERENKESPNIVARPPGFHRSSCSWFC